MKADKATDIATLCNLLSEILQSDTIKITSSEMIQNNAKFNTKNIAMTITAEKYLSTPKEENNDNYRYVTIQEYGEDSMYVKVLEEDIERFGYMMNALNDYTSEACGERPYKYIPHDSPSPVQSTSNPNSNSPYTGE